MLKTIINHSDKKKIQFRVSIEKPYIDSFLHVGFAFRYIFSNSLISSVTNYIKKENHFLPRWIWEVKLLQWNGYWEEHPFKGLWWANVPVRLGLGWWVLGTGMQSKSKKKNYIKKIETKLLIKLLQRYSNVQMISLKHWYRKKFTASKPKSSCWRHLDLNFFFIW